MKKRLLIFTTLFLALDQILKVVIRHFISYGTSLKVINNFFYNSNVHNDGAAFSSFSGNTVFLIGMTLFSLVIVYYCFVKDKSLKSVEVFFIGMLLGGILGNLVDRVIFQYVTDYLEFIIFGYHFPIFNFADICIVVSVITLLILNLKEDVWKNTKSKKKAVA